MDGMTSPNKPPTDPRYRVYRGGSCYIASATIVRAAFRDGVTPLYRDDIIGFRCSQRGARMPLKVTP